IYRTRLLIMHDKLYLASQAVLFWSFSELSNQKNKFTVPIAHHKLSTFPQRATLNFNDIKITGGLYDVQGMLNVNNLTDKKAASIFINLLKKVVPKTGKENTRRIALALQDWLSPYDLSRGNDS